MLKRKFLLFSIYILGIITPFMLAWILFIFGVKFPKSKSENALSMWRIDECNESLLFTNIQAENGVWFSIGIHRDPNTGFLQKMGIVKGPENLEGIFSYLSEGKYEKPMASYGLTYKRLYVDFDGDGQLDQYNDYIDKKKLININNQWIWGKGDENIVTELGTFLFDPNIGEWRLIDNNSIH